MAGTVDIVVVVTTGKQDRGVRVTLALSWALAALALGKSVTLFFTMDGTEWTMRGAMRDVQVAGYEPVLTYFEQFVLLGGQTIVCAPCSEFFCRYDRKAVLDSVIPEASLGGLSTVVSMVARGTSVVTF